MPAPPVAALLPTPQRSSAKPSIVHTPRAQKMWLSTKDQPAARSTIVPGSIRAPYFGNSATAVAAMAPMRA